MIKLETWVADFKDNPAEIDRSKWDSHRDLVVEVQATGREDARARVFRVAHKALRWPFLDRLEKKS